MWTIDEGTGKLVLSPIEKRSSKRIEKSTKESLTREGSLSPDADRDGLDKRSSDEGGPPEFKTPQSPSGQAVSINKTDGYNFCFCLYHDIFLQKNKEYSYFTR